MKQQSVRSCNLTVLNIFLKDSNYGCFPVYVHRFVKDIIDSYIPILINNDSQISVLKRAILENRQNLIPIFGDIVVY